MERIIITSDHQCRYNDLETEKSVLKFVRDFKPTTVVVNGDLVDLESVGKYRKTPEAMQSLVADIDAGKQVLKNLRKAAPDADIHFTFGNHEDRMANFILDKAPELFSLSGVTLETLLETEKLGITVHKPWGAGLDWNDVFIYHGTLVSKHSGASAKAEREVDGGSGVSGHTQRVGMHAVSERSGVHTWIEGGCMCNVRGDNVPPSFRGPRLNNWQQAIVVGYADHGHWTMYPVLIYDHKFIFNDKLYSP